MLEGDEQLGCADGTFEGIFVGDDAVGTRVGEKVSGPQEYSSKMNSKDMQKMKARIFIIIRCSIKFLFVKVPP